MILDPLLVILQSSQCVLICSVFSPFYTFVVWCTLISVFILSVSFLVSMLNYVYFAPPPPYFHLTDAFSRLLFWVLLHVSVLIVCTCISLPQLCLIANKPSVFMHSPVLPVSFVMAYVVQPLACAALLLHPCIFWYHLIHWILGLFVSQSTIAAFCFYIFHSVFSLQHSAFGSSTSTLQSTQYCDSYILEKGRLEMPTRWFSLFSFCIYCCVIIAAGFSHMLEVFFSVSIMIHWVYGKSEAVWLPTCDIWKLVKVHQI